MLGDGQGGKDNGQVSLNRVKLMVEYRPGFKVGFGHTEGFLYLEKLVVVINNFNLG